ncbi:flagellar basal body rod protein FlgB [Xylophilus ampelinus]|uniref:Flagellar basal body rod protein FlgB n=1 Tax=Xylophilus ampelinus TaxID=54067 RepID=A0A318SJ24_9BURK|nr:flagellar basal body protein [Xylophilus ampelinus]MCS4511225.1 flagellar basal body protein [Xylophilus ampelinus]PYE75022.1 flagellar basal-body rod protein FlgB [Xylophilus ampelinus]
MLDKLTQAIDFQGKALVMRAERQRNIASNIANADTPGYAARDFKFADAMRDATGNGGTALGALRLAAPQSGGGVGGSTVAMGTGAGHIPLTSSTGSLQSGSGPRMDYTVQSQPSMDGNSVDLDRERAAFTDNSVRYEATLRFINGSAKTMLTAIQGQ